MLFNVVFYSREGVRNTHRPFSDLADAQSCLVGELGPVEAEEYMQNHLKERSAPGLHSFCEAVLIQKVAHSARILDIAAGTGSFCQRLLAAEYDNVTANEIDKEAFALPQIPLLSVDLNTRFSEAIGQSWDVIIAMEVIEHLENPFQFLRLHLAEWFCCPRRMW